MNYKNKEWLKTQLEEKKLSVKEIAQKENVSTVTIYNWMNKFGLESYWGNVIDETGNRYGKYRVIEFMGISDDHHDAMWKCLHDDGHIHIFAGYCLRRGRVNGRNPGTPKLPKGQAAFNNLYKLYIKGAKERELEFDLSKEQFRELTQQDCYYCGASPSTRAGSKKTNGYYVYNGLDRIDNSKGYTLDNVVPCCKKCNQLKGPTNRESFLKRINQIYEYLH